MIGRILGWSSLVGVAVLAVLVATTWSQATTALPGEEVAGSMAATLRGGGCGYATTVYCSDSQYNCIINGVQNPCKAATVYDVNGPGWDAPGDLVCCGALCGMACNVYAANTVYCYITVKVGPPVPVGP